MYNSKKNILKRNMGDDVLLRYVIAYFFICVVLDVQSFAIWGDVCIALVENIRIKERMFLF